jgi:MFS family permease
VGDAPQWAAFTAVCSAYLAVTVGESILAPVFPAAADELGLSLAPAGVAFGLLTGSIAVGNVAGGYVMARRGPKVAILVALVVAAVGSLLAATTTVRGLFFVAQSLLGLGAGLFFAPGISVTGRLGGSRKGMAMALFGTAFSVGLAVAALLSSLGARIGWRLPFAVGAVMSAVAFVVVLAAGLPGRQVGPAGGVRKRLRDAIGLAAAVGSVGALTQYGTVAFLPAFAVEAWDLSAGSAALVLAASRVASVPAKVVTGSWADRLGAPRSAARVGVLLAVSGACWALAPSVWVGAVPAVVFGASASSVFPIANLLAFEGFGDRGPLLGTYRSVQMGVGAVGGASIGGLSSVFGLRPTLAVSAVCIPATLVVLGRRRPSPA